MPVVIDGSRADSYAEPLGEGERIEIRHARGLTIVFLVLLAGMAAGLGALVVNDPSSVLEHRKAPIAVLGSPLLSLRVWRLVRDVVSDQPALVIDEVGIRSARSSLDVPWRYVLGADTNEGGVYLEVAVDYAFWQSWAASHRIQRWVMSRRGRIMVRGLRTDVRALVPWLKAEADKRRWL